MSKYYIGLMSGTSMDGVDVALVEFANGAANLIAQYEEPIPHALLNKLHRLANPLTSDINLLGECDSACGELFAAAALNLLELFNVPASNVIAIGSHGQTVRHMPNAEHPFSIQIGDANVISARTGIDTIADFRRKDIALGGQGAPLVPAFHQKLFHSSTADRVILNIGGIANITWLPAASTDIKGFDTGPGNTLLDYWYSENNHQPFDRDGDWASQGTCCDALLRHMLRHPYFAESAPKSTGRELFNPLWLTNHLNDFSYLSAQDVQATLSQLTVESIAQQIEQLSASADVFLCGGGVFNLDLVARLTKRLPEANIGSTMQLGLAPQWLEAIAFAWLAYCHIQRIPANLPQVTGAKKLAVLGGFFPAV